MGHLFASQWTDITCTINNIWNTTLAQTLSASCDKLTYQVSLHNYAVMNVWLYVVMGCIDEVLVNSLLFVSAMVLQFGNAHFSSGVNFRLLWEHGRSNWKPSHIEKCCALTVFISCWTWVKILHWRQNTDEKNWRGVKISLWTGDRQGHQASLQPHPQPLLPRTQTPTQNNNYSIINARFSRF